MFNTFVRLALFSLFIAAALPAQSQTWPSKPIRWVVGYPAGGGTDIIVRLLADEMSKAIGQPVIVDNKPGANTMIAAEYVARAQPDGYTILVADNGTLVNNAALYKKLSYDPVADFDPVSMIGRFQFVLLSNPATGIKTFADMKRLVAADPSTFNYASGGIGSPFHIGMELLKQEQGLSINHVPYKGMAPAVQALLSGDVQLMIADIATALPYIKAGKLAALATVTPKRTSQLPEVPTLTELGVSSFPGWQALVVPSRTPDDIKAKLESALRSAVASPAAVRLFQEKGVEAVLSTPAELRSYQQAEIGRWHKFIHDRGISLD